MGRLLRQICCIKDVFAREMPLILTDILPLRDKIIYVLWREWRTKAVFSALPKIQTKHLKSPANLLTSLSWMWECLLFSFARVPIALAFVRGLAWVCFDVLPCSTQSLRVPMCPIWKRKTNTSKERIALGLMRERNIVVEHKG